MNYFKILYFETLLFSLTVAQHKIYNEWDAHKLRFDLKFKTGQNEDEKIKKSIWTNNGEFINKHNREYANGIHTYKMTQNKFTHLTYEEFIASHTGYGSDEENAISFAEATTSITTDLPTKQQETTSSSTLNSFLPTNIDWSHTILVGPVVDQGKCSASWAFSGIAALEGQQAKKSGKYVSLSPQQLVSCSKSNHGCVRGDIEIAYRDILASNTKGVDTYLSYSVSDIIKFLNNLFQN